MTHKLLGTVNSEGYEAKVWECGPELEHTINGIIIPAGIKRVFFVGDFDNDCDGSGQNPDHDPFFQPDTTLHHEGKAINPYVVPGMVVPLWLPRAVKGIVYGCLARVTHLVTMKSELAVVHDGGPRKKVGEGTPMLARRLGINPNPNIGGEDDPVILFECWPGVPAIVDGVAYQLQPV